MYALTPYPFSIHGELIRSKLYCANAGQSQDFPIISKGVGGMHVDEDDLSPSTGAKRSREDEPPAEPAWTEEEVETVQSVSP